MIFCKVQMALPMQQRVRPATKKELQEIIQQTIREKGDQCDLNFIDTSLIEDMSFLFANMSTFNGNISEWDVSNVRDMRFMFYKAELFNGDLSRWNTSNVRSMKGMFALAKRFNGDISRWNVSNVRDMSYMFYYAESFNCGR